MAIHDLMYVAVVVRVIGRRFLYLCAVNKDAVRQCVACRSITDGVRRMQRPRNESFVRQGEAISLIVPRAICKGRQRDRLVEMRLCRRFAGSAAGKDTPASFSIGYLQGSTANRACSRGVPMDRNWKDCRCFVHLCSRGNLHRRSVEGEHMVEQFGK
jgi:hypothetical protein